MNERKKNVQQAQIDDQTDGLSFKQIQPLHSKDPPPPEYFWNEHTWGQWWRVKWSLQARENAHHPYGEILQLKEKAWKFDR